MELYSLVIDEINRFIAPILVIGLVGTGIFLTFRLKFIQFRRLGHGFAVATGRYDDPNEPGDVSHFQALTTALSATVGIGNIDRKSTRLNSSHVAISYAVFCLKKKKKEPYTL